MKKDQCSYKIPHTAKGNHYYFFSEEEEKYHCPNKKYAPTDYCVFHAPKPDESALLFPKLVTHFKSNFSELIEKNTGDVLDFRGFIFPEFEFERKALLAEADFSFAIFTKDIDFAVLIENPNPEHEYDDERSLLLKHGAKFPFAIFEGKATFGNNISGELDFTNAKFKSEICIGGLYGLKKLIFDGTEFDKPFGWDSRIDVFSISFDNAIFNKNAQFTYLFANNVSFGNAKFLEDVEFYRCSLGYDPTDEYNHSEKINGSDSKDDDSEKETPEGFLHFDSIKFYGEANFFDTGFINQVGFSSCVFHKQALFYGHRTNVFMNGCDFQNVNFFDEGKLIFEFVDLSKASFHDTDLTSVIFREIDWGKAKGWGQKLIRGKSHILWDEIRPLEGTMDSRSKSKTVVNYSQLVINHENKRDFEAAEYFHIGEMEMKRKRREYSDEWYELPDDLAVKTFGEKLSNFKYDIKAFAANYFNAYGIYLFSSRYGTSYKQALEGVK